MCTENRKRGHSPRPMGTLSLTLSNPDAVTLPHAQKTKQAKTPTGPALLPDDCASSHADTVGLEVDDFSLAIAGLHMTSPRCDCPRPVLRVVEAAVPHCKGLKQAREQRPVETPLSKQMRRLLKDLRKVNEPPSASCSVAGGQADPQVSAGSADSYLLTAPQLCVPSLAATRKAAHHSHMRMPRHISVLLSTSLTAEAADSLSVCSSLA